MGSRDVPKRGNADEWPLARIVDLSIQEIRQLLENAERLHEPVVAERCRAALRGASSRPGPRAQSKPAAKPKAVRN